MYRHFFKRFFDILLSILALPFVAIIIAVIAPIIYFTDKGPIFYVSERIGRYGKPFKIYKLRSMYKDSPDIRLPDGSTYNSENDSRVTPIGRFIRETSIDELPQLINVIQGRMSLIGPRPDTVDWLDKYPEDIRVFLTVRPGITGYSQAYYRNNADSTQKMYNDAYYAKNYSFVLDLKILFKTIAVVIKRENIYCNSEETDAAQEKTSSKIGK